MSYGPGFEEGWTREGEPGYGPPTGGGRRHRAEPDDDQEDYGEPAYGQPGFGTPGYPHQAYGPQDYEQSGGDRGYQSYPQGPPGYDQGYGGASAGYGQSSYAGATAAYPSAPDYPTAKYPTQPYYGPTGPPRAVEPPRGGEFGYGGGPNRLARRPDPAGGYGRPPAPRRPTGRDESGGRRPRRRPKVWFRALVAIGALIVFGSIAYGTDLLGSDGSPSKKSNASGSPSLRDIGTRDLDPTPLTAAEVFPATSVPAKTGLPYQVLKTQASTDCGVAATGDLAKALKTQGCSQVVRATLKTGDSLYVITAGLFNLVDEAGAEEVNAAIKPTVDAGKGRFVGYVTDASTKAFATAPTYIGFDSRGHFLAYCVIARTDGKPFSAKDSALRDITVDLVEAHLFDAILTARASRPAGASASAHPSASAS